MEEDIKILEEFTESSCCLASQEEIIECVKNLIKGYKLEKLKNVLDEQSLKEALADYIPKSKIKEKIEELETKLKVFEKDIRYCKERVQARLMNDEIYVLRRCRNLLQELMEDK